MANVRSAKATLHIGAAEIVTGNCVRIVRRAIKDAYVYAYKNTPTRQDHASIVTGIGLTGSVRTVTSICVFGVHGSGQDASVRTEDGAIQWGFQ